MLISFILCYFENRYTVRHLFINFQIKHFSVYRNRIVFIFFINKVAFVIVKIIFAVTLKHSFRFDIIRVGGCFTNNASIAKALFCKKIQPFYKNPSVRFFFFFVSFYRNIICGAQVTKHRLAMKISQKKLADKLQILGLDIDKNAIQRIEAGKRFVTDIEIIYLCKVFGITYSELLPELL